MNKYKAPNQVKHAEQGGFTLLEILVTIIVLAIGLLGIASLQNTSIKLSYDAYLRSQASLLSYDLMDRIRANQSPTATYAFNTVDGTSPPAAFTGDCYIDSSGQCNATQMAQSDIREWFDQAEEIFPDGKFKLENTATAPDTNYEITISWLDRYENEESTEISTDAKEKRGKFVFNFDL